MSVEVRDAHPQDEREALRIILAAMGTYREWRPNWTPPADAEQRERERWRSDDRVANWLVACEDGRVMGVCRWQTGEPATLSLLMIDPACWGRGVGHALHEHALQAMAHCGTSAARLTVPAENTRARRFYERHGWRRTSTPPTRHTWLGLPMLAYETSRFAQGVEQMTSTGRHGLP